MHTVLLGGTGFIGSALSRSLSEQGDTVQELLLGGQNVVPRKLLDVGFLFHLASLPLALERSLFPS